MDASENVASASAPVLGDLRPIAPIELEGIDLDALRSGPPIIEWVDPCSLFVDEAYQRNVSPRGRKLIEKIISNWDWSKFKPPICAFAEIEGNAVLKVLDGQHTAIGAASHPDISLIPVVVVEAADTASQAKSFVSHNTDRIAVTNLQLHRAALTSGDEKAVTVQQTCDRAGVRILRQPPSTGIYEVGDTIAVQSIYALVERRFAIGARKVLDILVNAGFAPITVAQIKAAEFLITDPDHAAKVTPEDLTEAIRGCYAIDHDEAKRLAVSHKAPLWRALVMVWFKKCRKRRAATKGLQ
jgi:hypothetical protein